MSSNIDTTSTTTTQATMRAWTHTRAGAAADVLTLSTIPRPSIQSPTQVLIRISYCALNPAGSIVMRLLPFMFRGSDAVPEMDFSGVVVEVGSDVQNTQSQDQGDGIEEHDSTETKSLNPGTRVFGSIPLAQHVKSTCGALSEYIVLDHIAVYSIPDSVPPDSASGLGIAGATALELIKAANLKTGERVLLNAAAGGIGHLALQMVRDKIGKEGSVVAVCSGGNEEWLRRIYSAAPDANMLPSLEVVDYKKHSPVESYLATTFGSKEKQFTTIIDAIGIQSLFHASPSFLAPQGTYISVGPRAATHSYGCIFGTLLSMASNMLWPRVLGGTPRRYVQITAASSEESIHELGRLVTEGRLRVYVGRCVGMEDAIAAYGDGDGKGRGKTVVRVQKDDGIERE